MLAPSCGWHTADLEQLKSECLDLGPYAVPRGLIRGASQQCVPTLCLGVQDAALVWVLAFGYAFSWVFATIGLVTRNPEAAQFAAALPLFVLVFASSAFVPVPALPGWLQAFANARPHVDQARIVARGLAAAGKPVSRRALRSNGIKGSSEALNALARMVNTETAGGGARCSGWLTRPAFSMTVVWLPRLAEHINPGISQVSAVMGS